MCSFHGRRMSFENCNICPCNIIVLQLIKSRLSNYCHLIHFVDLAVINVKAGFCIVWEFNFCKRLL